MDKALPDATDTEIDMRTLIAGTKREQRP